MSEILYLRISIDCVHLRIVTYVFLTRGGKGTHPTRAWQWRQAVILMGISPDKSLTATPSGDLDADISQPKLDVTPSSDLDADIAWPDLDLDGDAKQIFWSRCHPTKAWRWFWCVMYLTRAWRRCPAVISISTLSDQSLTATPSNDLGLDVRMMSSALLTNERAKSPDSGEDGRTKVRKKVRKKEWESR